MTSEYSGSKSDLPARALAAVRKSTRQRRVSEIALRRGHEPQFSGAGASDRDPAPIGSSIDELVETRGWHLDSAVGRVKAKWTHIVGNDIASHVQPNTYDGDSLTLHVVADSATWATQIRLLAPHILGRIDAEIGPGVVKQLTVSAGRRSG